LRGGENGIAAPLLFLFLSLLIFLCEAKIGEEED